MNDINNCRYQLLHSEDLLKAFQALDTESKGHLTVDEAKNFFTRHGEAFAQVAFSKKCMIV